MLMFPLIDPVAFHLGPLPIRWYGLAYVAGFVLGLWCFKYFTRKYPSSITTKHADDMFLWVILGIIIGGRMGYVLFYNPAFFFSHPLDIFKTWQGGMSFHGGMIGAALAVLLYTWRSKVNLFDALDRLAVATPIGLFFGRLANFINGELYGDKTTLPLGMVFPGTDGDPRHPSQLYEAGLEGLVLFAILFFVAQKRMRRFELTGLFLIFYGSFRFLVEFVRARDAHLADGIFATISMGQILSLPMIVIGVYFVYRSWVRTHNKK